MERPRHARSREHLDLALGFFSTLGVGLAVATAILELAGQLPVVPACVLLADAGIVGLLFRARNRN